MEVLESSDIRERILVRLRKEGGTFEGTTSELFKSLRLDDEYRRVYVNALYYLKKIGAVESNSEGQGSPATSYWLLDAPEKKDMPPIDLAVAVSNLVVEVDSLRKENEALNKENEDLSRRFLEIQEILNRA